MAGKARTEAAADSAVALNGGDWLTRELGRRPTLEERMERARLAAIRMGSPCEPAPPWTEAEKKALDESTRRIRAVRWPKVGQKSEDLIRELRDAAVGIYPKRNGDAAGR